MKQRFFFALLIVFATFASCRDDDKVVMQAPEISGVENAYILLEGAKLELNPDFKNTEEASYLWYLDGKDVAKTQSYVFDQAKPGDYKLVLKVTNEGGVAEYTINIVVGAKDIIIEGAPHAIIRVVLPDYLKEREPIEWGEITGPSPIFRFTYNPKLEETPLFVAGALGEFVMKVNWAGVDGTITFVIK